MSECEHSTRRVTKVRRGLDGRHPASWVTLLCVACSLAQEFVLNEHVTAQEVRARLVALGYNVE